MDRYNGFQINTNVSHKKFKLPNFKKLLRNPLFKGLVAIFVVFLLVLTFLNVVPLKKVTVIEKCVMTDTYGNKEISYYNKQGRLEKTEQYNTDLMFSHKLYIYNKDGQIEKIEIYYNDALFDIEKYSYTDGLLTEKVNESVEGKLYGKTVYIYTEGILSLSTVFDDENKAISETQYKYDKSHCVQKIETTVSNGYVVTTDYEYENGNVQKEIRTSDNGTKSTLRFTYDKYGNVLSKSSGAEDYTIYTYTYKTKKVPVL